MTQNFIPDPTLEPLQVGKVISASLRIYRDNFKSYIAIALQASLWGFVPFLAFIVFISLDYAAFQISAGLGILVLLGAIGIWTYVSLYCADKSLQNSALISRLTFQLLRNQPETVVQARKQLPKQKLIFFITQFLASVLIFLANIFPQLFQGFLGFSSQNEMLSAILSLVGLAVYLWVLSRLFIPEVVVAIEKKGPIQSITRSWEMTGSSVLKITLILFLAYCISLPVYFLPIIPIVIGIVLLVSSFFGLVVNSSTAWNFATIIPGINLIVVGIFLVYFVSILIIPFWQTLKGVIYFDLRSRQEDLNSIQDS
jgi:hypothetical protein